jgi:hypothetical protein
MPPTYICHGPKVAKVKKWNVTSVLSGRRIHLYIRPLPTYPQAPFQHHQDLESTCLSPLSLVFFPDEKFPWSGRYLVKRRHLLHSMSVLRRSSLLQRKLEDGHVEISTLREDGELPLLIPAWMTKVSLRTKSVRKKNNMLISVYRRTVIPRMTIISIVQ